MLGKELCLLQESLGREVFLSLTALHLEHLHSSVVHACLREITWPELPLPPFHLPVLLVDVLVRKVFPAVHQFFGRSLFVPFVKALPVLAPFLVVDETGLFVTAGVFRCLVVDQSPYFCSSESFVVFC